MDKRELQRTILSRYDEIARTFRPASASSCCPAPERTSASSCCPAPERASASSCCPAPTCGEGGMGGVPPTESGLGCARLPDLVELFPGENLLDLGSGPGLETLAFARRVDPGRAFGLDALPSMVEVATENARRAGVTNVTFVTGPMEAVPLEDEAVDVVASNCVVNLSQDKEAVAAEIWRVLRPGGRVAIADMVWLGAPPAWVRNAAEAWACCVGGALEVGDYSALLEKAGFVNVDVHLLWTATSPPGQLLPALGGTLVTARKPGSPRAPVSIRGAEPCDLPLIERILQAARLPEAGVAEHLSSFAVACTPEGQVVGVAGLERYPSCVLLRSLVVLPGWRRQGLGRRLAEYLLARLSPATAVFLLTTDAQAYFRRLGFAPVPRHQAPGELSASVEFQGACPESATLMAYGAG